MKENYRLFLFPLKIPKTSATTTHPNSPLSTSSTTPSQSTPLISHAPETLTSSTHYQNPTPIPFLFAHLSKNMNRGTNPTTGLNRRNPFSRFLNWGEAKWHEYGEAPRRSIKGIMFRLGSSLLDKIPVEEKQLWRLHAIHQHLLSNSNMNSNSASSTDLTSSYKKTEVSKIVIETGSAYLDNPSIEQLLRFDLTGQFNNWAAYHRRWSILSSVLIFPVAILSILPFGKLLLAWIIFRAVAHWRAYQGAHFLVRCFNFDRQSDIKDILPLKFIVNPILDQYLPLPPTFTPETRGFNDPFSGLARDLELVELGNVLPKALANIVKIENNKLKNAGSGMKRRKFSNQNLLDP